MLDDDPPFRPVRRHNGYPPLEDVSLIGDGSTCAIVGLDGAIPWMWTLDASLLALPLRRIIEAGHPRMVATTKAVGERLSGASLTGLLSEQINPSTGEFMGNFPQAFSRIGVIFSGLTLAAAGWQP